MEFWDSRFGRLPEISKDEKVYDSKFLSLMKIPRPKERPASVNWFLIQDEFLKEKQRERK